MTERTRHWSRLEKLPELAGQYTLSAKDPANRTEAEAFLDASLALLPESVKAVPGRAPAGSSSFAVVPAPAANQTASKSSPTPMVSPVVMVFPARLYSFNPGAPPT